MTLAQRFTVAIGVVTVATTLALGLGVREAWRRTEAEQFRGQFVEAVEQLRRALGERRVQLARDVEWLCSDDATVDAVLVDMRAGRLDSRRLAISELVPKLMRRQRVNELSLVTGDGLVLGTGDKTRVGTTQRDLAARIARAEEPSLRTDRAPIAFEATCEKRAGGHAVGIVAALHIEPLLREVATGYGLELSLTEPEAAADVTVHRLDVPELGGLPVYATQSRIPLRQALRRLDTTVLAIGAGVFAIALFFALLLSRGLARPIESLAAQAREVVAGEPKPVRATGGRELVELSSAFNETIADLTAMRKRLAATERIAARREIARRVAHEIKNPLAPIRASVETLRRLRARDDERFDEYFDEATKTVLEEVARITTIVSEFTRFARLPPPDPAPVDLVQIARKVTALHQEGDVDLELRTKDCPEVNADADQIVQVLTNLVQNAIDAAAGEAQPRVVVQVEPKDDTHVVLRVRDNGPGFAPEIRERLFEPYATTKEHGTGLGLAIVERIVMEHAGEISVADARGGGAEVTVVIPVSGPTLLPQAPTSTPLGPPRSR